MSAIDSAKEALEKAKQAAADVGARVKDAAENVKDASSEAIHKASADAESAKRADLGDDMTVGQKAGSVLSEASDRTKAAIDRTKIELRDAK